ncbi:MAG: tripartite tricarboxylate transporter permease [Mycobacterium sp.]
MLHDFAIFGQSLGTVLMWPTIGYIFLGVFIGFWVGILPGLGGTTAMALMLPFVFTMEPITAVAFLLSMRAVAGTSSDVTSILFGIPGDSSAAATVFDGHPLARAGQAGRAVGAALGGSLIAGILGALFLLIALPLVEPLVLSFGPAEFFMLAILGLSFVVVLSGKAVVKGLIMAAVGMLISTVGQHPGTGAMRFTFGETYLFDGVDLVVATIGLFAVPTVVVMMIRRSAISGDSSPGATVDSGWRGGFMESVRHWWLITRCSAIGAGVGLIPGIGGSSSQFLAYGHAKQTSKHPEEFGKGSIEGVIAAGSNNNSNDGAQLVPTIAFGVPASTSMAILLAAFVVTGIAPGPGMLEEHLDVTFGMVWTIIAANIIAFVLCIMCLKYVLAVTKVRVTFLVPFLLFFIAVGAYATSQQWLDIVFVLIFGAIGVAAERYGWPVPPLLLGLVLGYTAETNLYLATSLSGGYSWLTHPGVIVIALVILLGVFTPQLRSMRKRRVAAEDMAGHDDEVEDTHQPSIGRVAFPLIIVAIAAFGMVQMFDGSLPSRASRFPLILCAFIIAIGIIQVFRDVTALMGVHRDVTNESDSGSGGSGSSGPSVPVYETGSGGTLLRTARVRVQRQYEVRREVLETVGAGVCWFALFFFMVWGLGFTIAIPVYTALYLWRAAKAPWWFVVVGTALNSAALFGLFSLLLSLNFFQGFLLSM